MAGSASDRVRQQQGEGRTMTPAEAAEALLAMIQPHEDHGWKQVGPCVYCDDCGVRLFQGRITPEHPNYRAPTLRDTTPKETRDMRSRWGKD